MRRVFPRSLALRVCLPEGVQLRQGVLGVGSPQ